MKKINKQYTSLIKELAITDFKLRYQGSVLGYLWSLMKPIMLFAVMYVVFTKIFKLGTQVPHYPAYLLLGIILWEFFVEVTGAGMDAIVSRGDLIRKVYFPKIVLVISRSFAALITFAFNLVAVLFFMLLNGVSVNWKIIFFPFLILEMLILIVGIAFFLSSLFVRFRDIAHIWDVVLRAMFYATPILYPLSIVPNNIAKFQMLSPVAQILQDARYILITSETLRASDYLVAKYLWVPYTLPIIVFFIGFYVFEKSASKFAEQV